MKKHNCIVSPGRVAAISVGLAAMFSGLAAAGEETVWKCGSMYTDLPQNQARQKCTAVSSVSAPGFKGEVKSMPADRKSGQAGPGAAQVAARDRESRQILEDELASVTARRNLLRDSLQASGLKSGKPLTPEDVQAQARAQELSRLDTDIEGLRREIARLPAEKAAPAP